MPYGKCIWGCALPRIIRLNVNFFVVSELDMTVQEVMENDNSCLENTISEEKSLEGSSSKFNTQYVVVYYI